MSSPSAKRILVIVSDRIGDVIFCTPALRLLREADPFAHIEVMAQSKAAAQVLRNNPCVDRVFVHDEATALAAEARFDRLLDLKANRTARQIAERLGIETERIRRGGAEHEAQIAIACVERATGVLRGAALRRYELYPDAADAARVASLLEQARVEDTDLLVGLHMGCNRVARRGWKLWKPLAHPKAWPVDRFRALVAMLRTEIPRLRFVLTGSAGELVLARRLLACAPDTVDLIGQTSVTELAALMSRLHLFVTADTGPLHVACATDVPIVALFGATPVASYGPWPPREDRVVLEGNPVATIPVSAVRNAVVAQIRKSARYAATASQAFTSASRFG